MNEIVGIGIDQGIANSGISLISLKGDKLTLLHEETLQTSSDTILEERILYLYDAFQRVYEKSIEYGTPASVIGCEKLLFNKPQKLSTDANSAQNLYRNKSASMMVVNMVTGIIALLAGQKGMAFYQFVPGTVKKYVAGHGRAKKHEVDEQVRALLPSGATFSTDHASDSAGIGITAVRKYKEEWLSQKAQ